MTNNAIQLVIWDWNGTLLADTEACMGAGNHVIETFGGKTLPRNIYSRVFDFPTLNFYCNQGADKKSMIANDFAGVFHEYYGPRASRCRTRKGAQKVLSWLNEKSIVSVILSNHLTGAIRQQLRRLRIEDHFAEVLANEEIGSTASGNNKIHRIKEYLSQSKYLPSQAIIIGDSPEDIGIGKELGMRTIGLTGGYFSTSRLKGSGPDHLIGNLHKVKEIIESFQ